MILYDCCDKRQNREGVILYCFERIEGDNIQPHERMENEYITYNTIHPTRLFEIEPMNWPYRLGYMTILEPCGNTNLCEEIWS